MASLERTPWHYARPTAVRTVDIPAHAYLLDFVRKCTPDDRHDAVASVHTQTIIDFSAQAPNEQHTFNSRSRRCSIARTYEDHLDRCKGC